MKTYYILMILFISAACYKEPSFELSPKITFNKIEKYVRIDQFSGARKDSIIVAVNFQDGDGDMGVNSEEIGKTVKRDDFNYNVKPTRKVKGVFQEFKPFESFSGFYPRLKTDNKKGPIEGKLSYRIQIETAFWPVKKDTVKFEIFVKDRAGNVSNIIKTDELIIN